MKILLVATESLPFCKTGGVADIVQGLARELNIQGFDARIIIPCYRGVLDREQMAPLINSLIIKLGTYSRPAVIWKAEDPFTTYLIEQYFYFDRNNFYGYLDDYERFIFFIRSVLQMLHTQEFQEKENWYPDIIHGFDWATGFLPLWLKQLARKEQKNTPPFILTIQNIKDTGIFGSRALRVGDLFDNGYYDFIGEEEEKISFLGRGLLFADKTVTANPYFGPTNPLPESAQPLLKVIHKRIVENDFISIHNGIDYGVHDPMNNSIIKAQFNEQSLQNRLKNKEYLQRKFNFELSEDIPLIGVVGQLTPQRGFNIFEAVKEKILDKDDIQFIALLEPSNNHYTAIFQSWENEWRSQRVEGKSRRKISFGFDEKLAQHIYAGCDIILLPYRIHPSGTQQLIAMRYGAIPVVHNTGSLLDTVKHYNPNEKVQSSKGAGIGICFSEFTPKAFVAAVQSAIKLFKEKRQTWFNLQRHNLRQDFSWYEPALEYIKLYQDVLLIDRSPEIPTGTSITLNRNNQLLQTILEIDSLPGLHVRQSKDMFKQVARLVRETVQCDAVYMWTREKEELEFENEMGLRRLPVAKSFDRYNERSIPPEETIHQLLNQNQVADGQRFGDFNLSKICRPIPNLETSSIAKELAWVSGWSAVITAHSGMLGRIDALFKANNDINNDWIEYVLTTIANSFGFRLEQIRYAKEFDQILIANQDLLSTKSFSEVIEKIIKQAKALSNAAEAHIILIEDGKLKEVGFESDRGIAIEVAQRAIEVNEVVYLKDLYHSQYAQPEELFQLRSLLAVPLAAKLGDQPLAVLVVAKEKPASFSRNDENLLRQYLAPQAAIALKTSQWHNNQALIRVNQLKKLSGVLTGGQNKQTLMDKVVNTITQVLDVDAATLFLADDKKEKLIIQAASGYQESLLETEEKPFYYWGEGVTGRIAKDNKPFRANSLKTLRDRGGSSSGKYDKLQGGKRPTSFYGLPLQVEGESKPIGVLKVESLKERPFTDEDQLLIEMMGNVIATVVYNTQISEKKLQGLSSNLGELSKVLTGGQDNRSLMNNIVNTIIDVLNVDAATLFLADEKKEKLIIQAASGYQKSLLEAKEKPFYYWGEGVTGRIAKDNKPFWANSLNVLREQGGSSSGKYDHLQGRKRPISFYGLPLRVEGQEKPIGVLKVESLKERPFTDEDQLLIEMLGNVIAMVVYNTQISEEKLRGLSTNLGKLSKVLTGGQDKQGLVDNIVNTIIEVLEVDAATLFLADEKKEKLIIQAASGYQKSLLETEEKPFYHWGEGVTGRIAKDNKPFWANSLNVLREQGGSRSGKYDKLQGGKRPTSFYGLPLQVEGESKPIGVLKVESLKERPFNDEDRLLIEMMGNVIATVVYNTQVSEKSLQSLSTNLGELSKVLTGGKDMQNLMNNIVNTIIEVLGVDAATLFLADDKKEKLIIQAASGYQKSLLEAEEKPFYFWGEGVTGRIAQDNKPFWANSLNDLREQGGSSSGKYDLLQGGKRPTSFYGLPLQVEGESKPIGVLKVESLRERPFNNEDRLLIQMMGNVVSTIIYTARLGETRMSHVLEKIGLLGTPNPTDNTQLLINIAKSSDFDNLAPMAKAIALNLDYNMDLALQEAEALYQAKINPAIYQAIADSTNSEQIRWVFSLLNSILNQEEELKPWKEVIDLARPWLHLIRSTHDQKKFNEAARQFTEFLASSVHKIEEGEQELMANHDWCGTELRIAKEVFGENIPSIPVIFHRQGKIDEETLVSLEQFVKNDLAGVSVVLLILWNIGTPAVWISTVQERLRKESVDVVMINTRDILNIRSASHPLETFRSLVLHQVTTTSPFIMDGPVFGSMFFGREKEIRFLLNNISTTDYAVVGNRKIGKTSLLLRLQDLIKQKRSDLKPLYIDCQAVSNEKDFFEWFETETELKLSSITTRGFQETLKNLKQNGPLPILLIDEVDALLEHETKNGGRLLATWRALANKGICHFIFFGSAYLAKLRVNPRSGYFNFAEPLTLGYLLPERAMEVIKKPLQTLGIKLQQEEKLFKKILKLTSGHPNLLQYIGKELVKAAHEHSGLGRYLQSEDVDVIHASNDFTEYYLQLIWGNADPLEKLITLLAPRKGFEIQQMESIIQQSSIQVEEKDLKDALQVLCNYSIFRKDNLKYTFIPKAFPKILHDTQDVARLISSEKLKLERKKERKKDNDK